MTSASEADWPSRLNGNSDNCVNENYDYKYLLTNILPTTKLSIFCELLHYVYMYYEENIF